MKDSLSSVFGIWATDSGSLVFKILPNAGGIRIKIFDVRRPEELQMLFSFAGLINMPRRRKWKDFDISTNVRRNGVRFEPGLFVLPMMRRRNLVNLNLVNKFTIIMEFFNGERAGAPAFSGSLVLRRSKI